MPADSLFRQLSTDAGLLSIEFDGQTLQVPAGVSLAAALLASSVRRSRWMAYPTARPAYCRLRPACACVASTEPAA